nr:unnamed protein product [Spirometra erinaceieuropaei]
MTSVLSVLIVISKLAHPTAKQLMFFRVLFSRSPECAVVREEQVVECGRTYLRFAAFIFALYICTTGLLSNFTDLPNQPAKSKNNAMAVTNNIVLMVIDALRSDMISSPKYSANWPMLKRIMRQGIVECSTTTLSSPTVTSPRIKTISTGRLSVSGEVFPVGRVDVQALQGGFLEYHCSAGLYLLAGVNPSRHLHRRIAWVTVRRPSARGGRSSVVVVVPAWCRR